MEATQSMKRVKVSVFPTEEELQAWNSLTRDEQLYNIRKDLEEAAAEGRSDRTMQEIIESAERKAQQIQDTI